MIKQSKENTVHILNGLKENTSFFFSKYQLQISQVRGPRVNCKLLILEADISSTDSSSAVTAVSFT